MLGILYFVVVGLSFKFKKKTYSNIEIEYKLEGVVLMKMMILSFLVGNSACGVFSQLEEKVC